MSVMKMMMKGGMYNMKQQNGQTPQTPQGKQLWLLIATCILTMALAAIFPLAPARNAFAASAVNNTPFTAVSFAKL
jgi:hypothetical protein